MGIVQWVVSIFRKIFGTRNDRIVKVYRRRAAEITALEPRIRAMTDDELRERTVELRAKLAAEEVRAGEVMSEAMAIMREALDRYVGIRSIFDPERKGAFAVEKLSEEMQGVYRRIEKEVEEAGVTAVLGQEEAVPGRLLVDVPNELYEAVREIYPESRPPFRCRPFEVQLIGGMVLYEGKIGEMKTGEGKTIVAPLACYMAVLEGLKCNVVTVNDYLVQRDRDWVFPAFYRLGINVGAIHPYHMQPPQMKAKMYECDIVYGTNSEFGFDYLRDNMKLSAKEQVQRRRDFCIIDEVDSILIDEARTPLIISGPAHDDAPQYLRANQVAEELVLLQGQANRGTAARIKAEGFVDGAARAARVPSGQVEKVVSKFSDLGADFLDEKEADLIGHVQYYVVRREQKQANLTPAGVEQAQKIVGTRFYVVGNDMAWDHLISNALRAHVVYVQDKEYVVQNGEVVIVDEFTGRLMVGRQWSDGLHQAVEAKEAKNGVKIKQETQTLATITIQNFFKLYKRLAGMTGTAVTEATEFNDIYKLDVVVIPTNKPVIRDDSDDLIFLTEKAKWNAIVEEIRENAEAGRPVLVGTTSVEKSERLSGLLKKRHGIDHEVLNAKQHEREAQIVEKAGQQHEDKRGKTMGNVTIATNMAGRGTDIKLPDAVRSAGGLAIVGTERHESRRIDNQLRGRAGRQGDPGASRFFISMEDDLMKMFAGKTTMKALSMLGMGEEDAIEHKWVTKSVERAQRKVEERNYQIRKNLLEYDEVMEYQRNGFYGTRQAVLEGERVKEVVFEYIAEAIEDAVGDFLDGEYASRQLSAAVSVLLGVDIDAKRLRGENLGEVEGHIRSFAKTDCRQEIEVTVGEYMGEGLETSEWDLTGLSEWAESRFGVELRESRLREMSAGEVVDELSGHAQAVIEEKPLDGLERFFEADYAAEELAGWAKSKFGLELRVEELRISRDERGDAGRQRVAELIYRKADAAYRRREIEYPVAFVLEMVFGTAQQSADASAWAADQLVKWANRRFEMGWEPADVTSKNAGQLNSELVAAADDWYGKRLDEWIGRTVTGDAGQIAERFEERWGVKLSEEELEGLPEEREDRELWLRDRAERILRAELMQLEQYVLLQILDQSWKDHLYAMDQLKDSIGLRGFAEKDPKIEYKTEGAKYYRQMLVAVRDKVTDMIFKARLKANVQARNFYQGQQEVHQVDRDLGAGSTIPAEQRGTAEQRADLAAAEKAGAGDRQVVATIVNKQEKVGRNDPCPCGSGKKYKKCCGVNA